MKKILVVDDETMLRKVLADFLRDRHFDVFEADGGDKAFSLLQAQRFDLVISDIQMPAGDGLELLRRIQAEISSPPPLILISGYTPVTPEEVLKMGASALFLKPFNPAELMAHIQALFPSTQQSA